MVYVDVHSFRADITKITSTDALQIPTITKK